MNAVQTSGAYSSQSQQVKLHFEMVWKWNLHCFGAFCYISFVFPGGSAHDGGAQDIVRAATASLSISAPGCNYKILYWKLQFREIRIEKSRKFRNLPNFVKKMFSRNVVTPRAYRCTRTQELCPLHYAVDILFPSPEDKVDVHMEIDPVDSEGIRPIQKGLLARLEEVLLFLRKFLFENFDLAQ